jgi:hypothetical protein
MTGNEQLAGLLKNGSPVQDADELESLVSSILWTTAAGCAQATN